jgi:hypothetical protein
MPLLPGSPGLDPVLAGLVIALIALLREYGDLA